MRHDPQVVIGLLASMRDVRSLIGASTKGGFAFTVRQVSHSVDTDGWTVDVYEAGFDPDAA